MTRPVRLLLTGALTAFVLVGGSCSDDPVDRSVAPTTTRPAALPPELAALASDLSFSTLIPSTPGDRALVRMPLGGEGRPSFTVVSARPHGTPPDGAGTAIQYRSGPAEGPVGVFRASSSSAPDGAVDLYPAAAAPAGDLTTDVSSQLDLSADLPDGDTDVTLIGVDLTVRWNDERFTIVVPVVLTICLKVGDSCTDEDRLNEHGTAALADLLKDQR